MNQVIEFVSGTPVMEIKTEDVWVIQADDFGDRGFAGEMGAPTIVSHIAYSKYFDSEEEANERINIFREHTENKIQRMSHKYPMETIRTMEAKKYTIDKLIDNNGDVFHIREAK